MNYPKKTRLCIVIPSHWEHTMGGAQYQAQLLTEYLIGLGNFEIHYLARRINPNFIPTGYSVHQIGDSKGAGFVFDTRSLFKTLDCIKPHAIFQHVGCAYTGISAYYCKVRKCTLVWHIASDIDVEPKAFSFFRKFSLHYVDKKILEYGLRNARFIVGQTKHQENLLTENYSRKLSELVRNFHPLPVQSLEKADRVKVLWIANIKKIKQPGLFIRLAAALRNLNVSFIMMGAAQGERSWREQTMKDIEAAPNIEYLGPLSQDKVNEVVASSHILVNTSEYEGFSNTFIQAWMRQVPVISYNVDPDKLLSEGGLGLCANGNFGVLLEQLRTLILDVELRKKIGLAAQEYANNHHSIANMDKLVELFLR